MPWERCAKLPKRLRSRENNSKFITMKAWSNIQISPQDQKSLKINNLEKKTWGIA